MPTLVFLNRERFYFDKSGLPIIKVVRLCPAKNKFHTKILHLNNKKRTGYAQGIFAAVPKPAFLAQVRVVAVAARCEPVAVLASVLHHVASHENAGSELLRYFDLHVVPVPVRAFCELKLSFSLFRSVLSSRNKYSCKAYILTNITSHSF